MANSTDAQRFKMARKFASREFNDLAKTANMHLDDLKAAADVADQWADNNAASFNAALPEPFKSIATADQKTVLLAYVILERAGLL